MTFTAVIHRKEDTYVALCPELDIASQGQTIEEARHNLQEAIELILECADPDEIRGRSRSPDLAPRYHSQYDMIQPWTQNN